MVSGARCRAATWQAVGAWRAARGASLRRRGCLAYRLPSLFARGQLSRYGFRAAVVDYERSLSSLRAARAAVRQKARGAELAQGDTLASTLSAAAAKIQPTGRVTGCIPTQEYTCSTKNRRVQRKSRPLGSELKTNTAAVGASGRAQRNTPEHDGDATKKNERPRQTAIRRKPARADARAAIDETARRPRIVGPPPAAIRKKISVGDVEMFEKRHAP